MKEIKITHAQVIPFYDSEDIIREKELENGTTIVNFNVKTKASDSPKSQAVLYERCTVFANSSEQIEFVRKNIKENAIVEIDGHEERNKSKKNNKYYTSNVIKTITPISSDDQEAATESDDDLPF